MNRFVAPSRFREAISLAVVLVAAYLALNAVVVAAGLAQVATHPECSRPGSAC